MYMQCVIDFSIKILLRNVIGFIMAISSQETIILVSPYIEIRNIFEHFVAELSVIFMK